MSLTCTMMKGLTCVDMIPHHMLMTLISVQIHQFRNSKFILQVSKILGIDYIHEGLDGEGGSGIHYSLKIQPIIHLIKILGYSLK